MVQLTLRSSPSLSVISVKCHIYAIYLKYTIRVYKNTTKILSQYSMSFTYCGVMLTESCFLVTLFTLLVHLLSYHEKSALVFQSRLHV